MYYMMPDALPAGAFPPNLQPEEPQPDEPPRWSLGANTEPTVLFKHDSIPPPVQVISAAIPALARE